MYDIVLVEIFVLESLELKMCLFSPLDCLFKCMCEFSAGQETTQSISLQFPTKKSSRLYIYTKQIRHVS